MKKSAIKIIKRKDVAEKTRAVAKYVKRAANTNLKIVEAVNGWVFERQENRGKEQVFSDNKILSWELLPKTVEKTTS